MRRSPVSRLIVAGLLTVLAGIAHGQTILDGPSPNRAFQTPYTGADTIVQDSRGTLFVIYRYQLGTQWDVAIARSADGGANWNKTWQTGFATLGTDFGNYSPCIAIDSQDNLHCAWSHRVAFSGSRIPQTMRYNRYEAATNSWGTEWLVTPTPKFELNNCVLVVDQNDHVWFAHGDNSFSWHSYLLRSDKPFASDGKFTRYTPLYQSSGYSQHNCLCVDSMGRIHFTYYSSGPYGVHHQWVDPAAATPTWSPKTALSQHSGHTNRAEYSTKMAADAYGNVYLIYPVDSQYPTNNGSFDTEFYLRKWDGSTQTWSSPELIHNVPMSVWGASGYNDRIISCACDEVSSDLYFTYRDFNTGEFVIGRWRGIVGEAPTTYARLQQVTPPGPPNYFLYPHFRGSLWPVTNRTSLGLDLTYVVGDSTATNPTYTTYFERFPVASMTSPGTPKIGTTYPLVLSSPTEGGAPYVAAACVSGVTPLIQVGRRFIPLSPDSILFASATNVLPTVFVNFQAVLNAAGTGQAGFAIPNLAALVGVPVDTCFITYDASGVTAISNPWGFKITS